MFSPKRISNAFKFSSQGLASAWQTEAAFRDNFMLFVLAQFVCLWLQPPLWLWLMMVFANILLLVTELLNTGIEYLVDHISLEFHDLLGRAKDVGSAAVMLMLILNGIVFIAILYSQN